MCDKSSYININYTIITAKNCLCLPHPYFHHHGQVVAVAFWVVSVAVEGAAGLPSSVFLVLIY